MAPIQSPIAPRLILDMVSSLWLARESLHDYRQAQSKQPTLKGINLTQTEEAVFFLLELARHMRHVELTLKALDRPFEARNRVDHASMSEGRSLTAGAKNISTQLGDKEPD
jgi:hypothetical protein